jgi:PAS domain S-box-containing protein
MSIDAHNQNSVFRRISAALLTISICLVAAAALSMEVQSAIRAYVGGEGLWSKGQKEAVFRLTRLATSGDPLEYERFRAALDICLGDRDARLEMDKTDFSEGAARAGLLRGHNHRDDIGGMIRLYRYFHRVSYMERAIAVWARADVLIMELRQVGENLSAELRKVSPDQARIAALLAQSHQINDRLTPLEYEFSTVLGEASRAISRLLVELMLALSVALFFLGALAVRVLLARNLHLQEELGEREAHYRSLFENSVDAVLLTSPDGRVHEANGAACRLFGYTREELTSLGRGAVVPPDAEGLKEILEERERAGHVKAEMRMLRKDGSTFMADISSALFTDNAGRERAYLIVRDITQRKLAQARIERLNRFNTAFRQVSQAIARIREPEELYRQLCRSAVRDGGLRMAGVLQLGDTRGPMRVVACDGLNTDYFSQATFSADPESPFGRGPSGIAARSGQSVISNEFSTSSAGIPWREAMLRAGFTSIAAFPLRRYGAVNAVLVLYATETGFFDQPLVDLMEQLAHEVSFALEYIGEQEARNAAEADLRSLNHELEKRVAERTADLEATNLALHASHQEIGSFSYSVSHDLRGPLRAINGFATLLLTDHAQALNEEGRDYLRRLRDASVHMDRLTHGLLQLTQLGRTQVARAPLDLSAIARACAQELGGMNPARTIEWIIAPGLAASGDPVLVPVLLRNLLGNAWKFTRHKTRARIEFGANQHQGETVFFVSDNGCGFDMAYAARIFNAFSRLHSGAQYEGIGIGLPTVQRILQRHGGSIWVQAEPERGAIFFFTLPLHPQEARPPIASMSA